MSRNATRHRSTIQLDAPTIAQVTSLRKTGMDALRICDRLGITKSREFNAVVDLCHSLGRRYQHGTESGGPVKAGANKANVRAW